jgi:hypothetical protein
VVQRVLVGSRSLQRSRSGTTLNAPAAAKDGCLRHSVRRHGRGRCNSRAPRAEVQIVSGRRADRARGTLVIDVHAHHRVRVRHPIGDRT